MVTAAMSARRSCDGVSAAFHQFGGDVVGGGEACVTHLDGQNASTGLCSGHPCQQQRGIGDRGAMPMGACTVLSLPSSSPPLPLLRSARVWF